MLFACSPVLLYHLVLRSKKKVSTKVSSGHKALKSCHFELTLEGLKVFLCCSILQKEMIFVLLHLFHEESENQVFSNHQTKSHQLNSRANSKGIVVK